MQMYTQRLIERGGREDRKEGGGGVGEGGEVRGGGGGDGRRIWGGIGISST